MGSWLLPLRGFLAEGASSSGGCCWSSDSTDGFGLAAVILGIGIQSTVRVFAFVAMCEVEEDVLVFVASGVGDVWVDGRVGGVGGWGR